MSLAQRVTPARRGGRGRVVPIYHLYIVCTDPSGSRTFPRRPRAGSATIWLHHDGVRLHLEGTIDWATDAIAVTLAEGAAVGLDVCFRTELERIQSLRLYNLRGPNSNTVVRHCWSAAVSRGSSYCGRLGIRRCIFVVVRTERVPSEQSDHRARSVRRRMLARRPPRGRSTRTRRARSAGPEPTRLERNDSRRPEEASSTRNGAPRWTSYTEPRLVSEALCRLMVDATPGDVQEPRKKQGLEASQLVDDVIYAPAPAPSSHPHLGQVAH